MDCFFMMLDLLCSIIKNRPTKSGAVINNSLIQCVVQMIAYKLLLNAFHGQFHTPTIVNVLNLNFDSLTLF